MITVLSPWTGRQDGRIRPFVHEIRCTNLPCPPDHQWWPFSLVPLYYLCSYSKIQQSSTWNRVLSFFVKYSIRISFPLQDRVILKKNTPFILLVNVRYFLLVLSLLCRIEEDLKIYPYSTCEIDYLCCLHANILYPQKYDNRSMGDQRNPLLSATAESCSVL